MCIYVFKKKEVMQVIQEAARKEGQRDSNMRVFKAMISCQYSREEAQKISELTDEQVEAALEEMKREQVESK